MRMTARRHRGHQELFKGALFPFPGHRKAGEKEDLGEGQEADNAGEEEPPGDLVRVEPGPGFQSYRAFPARQVQVVPAHDMAGVAGGEAGNHGISSVRNDLHRRRVSPVQTVLEVLGDSDGHHRVSPGNVGPDFIGRRQVRHRMEEAGAVEPGEQLAGGLAVAHVHRHVGGVFQIVVGGVAEEEPQHNGRHYHDAAGGGVFPDIKDFLPADHEELLEEKGPSFHSFHLLSGHTESGAHEEEGI